MKKFITILVLAVTMLLTLAACQVETPCEHQYYKEITKRPTCVEEGKRTCTCKLCGDSYVETIQTTNHKYTSTVTKAATCTETGVETLSCATCGDSKTETIAKARHNYTEKVTKAATCKEEGVKTFTCSDCKDSYTEKIAKTSHSYKGKVTTAATCKAAGVKTYTCSSCGKYYTETIAKLSKHNYVSGYCSWCGTKDPNAIPSDVYKTIKSCLDTAISGLELSKEFYIDSLTDEYFGDLDYEMAISTLDGSGASVGSAKVLASSYPKATLSNGNSVTESLATLEYTITLLSIAPSEDGYDQVISLAKQILSLM